MARRKLTPEEKQRRLEEKINNENIILKVSHQCLVLLE